MADLGKIQSRSLRVAGSASGLSDTLCDRAAYIANTSGIPIISRQSGEISSIGRSSPGNVKKKGHRGGLRSQGRVLQSSVPGQEGNRRMETSSGRLSAQCLCAEDKVFHGDHPIGARVHSTERLDGHHGHEGRLLSCPDSPGISSIPQICFQQQSLSIQSPVLRVDYGSSGFHKGSSSSSQNSSLGRNQNNIVLRRLADTSKQFRRSLEGKGVHFDFGKGVGHYDQQRKVTVKAKTDNHVLRNSNQFCNFLGFPSSETNRQLLETTRKVSVLRRAASKILAKSTRSYVLDRKVHSGGKAQDETSPILSSPEMGQEDTIQQDFGDDTTKSVVRTTVVEQQRPSGEGYITGREEPRPVLVIRRISKGLGSNRRRPSVRRHLVKGRSSSPYKQPRVESSVVCSEGSRTFGEEQVSSSTDRQQDSSSLHSQARGYKIMGSILPGEGNLTLDRGKRDNLDASVYQRDRKCSGRFPESERPGSPNRMDSEQASVSPAVETVGPALDRSVCNSTKPQAASLHVPSYRPSGPSGGRYVTPLVQLGCLCLPTIRHGSASDKQSEEFNQLQNDSGSAVVASEGMVSRPDQPPRRQSKEVASQAGSSNTTPRKGRASKPPQSSVSRMETIVRFARTKKLSSKISGAICSARGTSTNALYQQRWATFYNWCKRNKHSSSRPSVNSLCEFFLYLFEEKQMAVDTIRGYRSTLHSVFRHTGLEINKDQDISDVIRSLRLRAPIVDKSCVSWYLDVVLKYLCSSKFEPLESCPLLELTQKTLFLVTIALAKRVSEIQALSRSVGFSREGAVVSFVLNFRAKNDIKFKGLPRNFLIKELSSLVGQEEEALLCPVRALRTYISRTKDKVGPNMSRLFVSPRNPRRPSSKNAISYFIKELVREAHRSLCPELMPILKVKIHELRAVSTSVSFAHNLSLESVMNAAQWRCNSVFASHYLKEVSIEYENCRTLGPLIAACTVIP